MDLNQRIGRRLTEVRRAQGLSQTAVGKLLGVSFQQVQKYENGTNRLSTESLIQLCHALGISAVEFLAPFDAEVDAPAIPALDKNLARSLSGLSPSQIKVVTTVVDALQSAQ